MSRRIEKKTEFMEKIEKVAKQYGVEKIYADRFDGNIIVDTTFLLDESESSEAYEAMCGILENPKGYSRDELDHDDDLLFNETNRIYGVEIPKLSAKLIYNRGEWYRAD